MVKIPPGGSRVETTIPAETKETRGSASTTSTDGSSYEPAMRGQENHRLFPGRTLPAQTSSTGERSELHAPLNVHPSEPGGPGEIMIATYNIENLFDAKDDPKSADEEFTPNGAMAWTDAKIDRKVANLGRVLKSTNGGRGPDILALVEVENHAVVTRLKDKGLEGLGYQSVAHVEGEDHRGIDNAIISRFPLTEPAKLHPVHEPGSALWGNKSTRGVLEATYEVDGHKLTVFVNHWPSKRGGESAEAQRLQAGTKLRALVDELRVRDPAREIVLLGDFNSNFGEAPLGPRGLGASEDAKAVRSGEASMLNTTPKGPRMGTHYYHPKDEWSTFDHILVSPTLLDDQGLAWVPGSTQIVKEPFMVNAKGAPKRFYQPRTDPRTQPLDGTGFSDHLPVVARLRRKSPA